VHHDRVRLLGQLRLPLLQSCTRLACAALQRVVALTVSATVTLTVGAAVARGPCLRRQRNLRRPVPSQLRGTLPSRRLALRLLDRQVVHRPYVGTRPRCLSV